MSQKIIKIQPLTNIYIFVIRNQRNQNTLNIIVTGGTKGIGLAICRILYKNGASLATCSRNIDDLERLKKDLSSPHNDQKVYIKKTDVSKKDEVLEFARFAKSELGRIDVLINNAGLFLPGSVYDEEEGALEKMMNTNLYSAYHLTRQIVKGMIDQGSGHIINMCSIASIMAYPNGGSYSISKYAMLGFSKVLREELKDKGIRVTSVIPGATWTDSWKGADFPKQRLMPAEDIALAVYGAIEMSASAVVEEIIIRPQLGDL